MKKLLLLVAIISVSVLASFANIANPDLPVKGKINTSLSIRLDKDAREARLIIPRSQIKQLRAELEQIDGGADDTAGAGGITRMQTIVSGGLISFALIFGGMWFIRTGAQNSKAVVVSSLLLAICSITTLVYANAGPPPEARSITGKMFSQGVHMYKGGWGKIKLEVSDKVQNPELIVPDTAKTADE